MSLGRLLSCGLWRGQGPGHEDSAANRESCSRDQAGDHSAAQATPPTESNSAAGHQQNSQPARPCAARMQAQGRMQQQQQEQPPPPSQQLQQQQAWRQGDVCAWSAQVAFQSTPSLVTVLDAMPIVDGQFRVLNQNPRSSR